MFRARAPIRELVVPRLRDVVPAAKVTAKAALLFACAAALVSPPTVAQPRMHLETLAPGGQLYTLSVPAGYSAAKPAPELR